MARPKKAVKPTKTTKSTDAQVEIQVKAVFQLLLEGRSRTEILEHCATQYKVGRGRADQIIKVATDRIQEINKNTLQTNLGLITNNQWELYRQAVAQRNLVVARQILMDIAKLRGLEQNTINHIIEDKRELADLSDDELDKILEGE